MSETRRETRFTGNGQFTLFSRLLHWTMAAMILAMLFIGVAMVVSLADYHRLVAIHRPLGIAILVLVVIRYVNRKLNPPPEFIASMPRNPSMPAKYWPAVRCAMPLPHPVAETEANDSAYA